MTDDEMWLRLRADLATADVDPAAASVIEHNAHARLREPRPILRPAIRTIEALAVTGAVIAQLAWAWCVVLG